MLSVSNYMTHIYHNFTRLGSILILSRKHIRMCMIYDVRKHMKSSFSYVWDFLVLKTCHVYSFQTYGSYVRDHMSASLKHMGHMFANKTITFIRLGFLS